MRDWPATRHRAAMPWGDAGFGNAPWPVSFSEGSRTVGATFLAPLPAEAPSFPRMRLAQNQVYRQGDEFLRIVGLNRLAVHYKAVTNLLTGEGKHHHVTKKEFCRLIKGAPLLSQEEVKAIWRGENPGPAPGETAG